MSFVNRMAEQLDKSTFVEFMALVRGWENGSTNGQLYIQLEDKFEEMYPEIKECFNACEKAGLGYPVGG